MCFLLFVITVVLFGRVVQNDFINYDDDDYVYSNPSVKNGLTAGDMAWAFTTFHANNWHPLTWISHQLDCQLFGLDPGPQHLVNVLFHAINAVLLFLLLVRMTGAIWPAGLVAALFAWHPLHVESVAWIAERKDVLSTFFGLLSLLYYVRHAQTSNASPAPTRKYYFLALLFFVLSLMAKPMLVTLPFVFLLLDYWPLRRGVRSEGRGQRLDDGSQKPNVAQLHPLTSYFLPLLPEKLPFLALAALSSVVTYLAQRSEAVVSFTRLPLGMRAANAVVAYVRYLGKIFWPSDLAVIYPLPHQLSWMPVTCACAVLIILSFLFWQGRKTKPYLLVGWLWFLGTLVPVIGLIQVGGQSMADRYAYFPSIGVFLMLAYGMKDLVSRMQTGAIAVWAAAAIALAALAILTERQLGYWANGGTIFRHAIEVTRNNDIALINLGLALEKQGQPEKALPLYYEALRINPDRVEVHNNIANLLTVAGRLPEAEVQYKEALQLRPNEPLPHMNLAVLYTQMGKTAEAMQEYGEAARLDPTDPRPHIYMAKACIREGRTADAIAHLHDALDRDPNNIEALTYLAHILASDEHPQLRDGTQAVALADRANTLSQGELPFVLDTLGMAYAETGRFQDAEQTAQKAIEAATAVGQTNLLSDLQQHLRLYQAGRPYREMSTKALP